MDENIVKRQPTWKESMMSSGFKVKTCLGGGCCWVLGGNFMLGVFAVKPRSQELCDGMDKGLCCPGSGRDISAHWWLVGQRPRFLGFSGSGVARGCQDAWQSDGHTLGIGRRWDLGSSTGQWSSTLDLFLAGPTWIPAAVSLFCPHT